MTREQSELRQRVAVLEGQLAVAEEEESSGLRQGEELREENAHLRLEVDSLKGKLRTAAADADSRGKRVAQLETQLREALTLQGMTPEEAGQLKEQAEEKMR
jgi:regulator of replication initiation timing